MVSPGTRSIASNQYHVPGMEYIIGTLILGASEHLRKSRVPVQLVRRNMYLIAGTEYVTGTLILRSFGVLEEVSSIGTAGTAEYVPGTWYLVRSDN